MPGSDLDLDLPTLGNTFADIVAKIVTALAAIQADLEPRIGSGSLDIDTEVSMNGAPLTNVGGIRLVNGGSSVVGTIYMDEELHAVTTAGDVQITQNGALAITALGVIGGDYGGSNPAEVTFQDSDGSYWFKEDPSTWSALHLSDIVFNGAAGTLRMGVAASFSGAQTLRYKTLPTDAGVLVYDASDDTYNDNSTLRADNLRAVDVDISGKVLHGEWTYSGNFVYPNLLGATGVVSANGTFPGIVIGDSGVSAAEAYLHIPVTLRSNERVKKVNIGFVTDAFTNAHVVIFTSASAGAAGWISQGPAGDTTSAVTNKDYTPTAPFKLTDRGLWVRVSVDAGSTVKPQTWTVTVDAID